MVDDELALLAEQIGECAASVRPLEHVFLLDRHHRQLAALGAHRVVLPGQLLLLDEQALAGGGPFVSRYNRWFRHVVSFEFRRGLGFGGAFWVWRGAACCAPTSLHRWHEAWNEPGRGDDQDSECDDRDGERHIDNGF